MNRRTLLSATAGLLLSPSSSFAAGKPDGIPYVPVDAFPYYRPGPELRSHKHEIDSLIWPAVSAINETGWVWTTQSCQGGGKGHYREPSIRMACRKEEFARLLEAVHGVQVAKTWRSGMNVDLVSVYRVSAPKGWREIGVQNNNAMSLWNSINYFNKLAKILHGD